MNKKYQFSRESKTRVCSLCGERKPLPDYNSFKKPNGLVVTRPECKPCHSNMIATRRLERLIEARPDKYGQCRNEECLKIQMKTKSMTCRLCGFPIDDESL